MSRLLILSDLHANEEAFQAVLDFAEGRYDEMVVLGDLVDYGPSPNQVVNEIRRLGPACIKGNHDAAIVGEYSLENFRSEWQPVARWTMSQITESNRQFLKSLPLTLQKEGALFVHANLSDPLCGYILNDAAAAEQFHLARHPLNFFGHTHITIVYERTATGKLRHFVPDHLSELNIQSRSTYLINPGSVGQPRNDDPRACACLWDTERQTVTFFRVPYPFEITQKKIQAAGLPEVLARRLAFGR